MTSLIVAHLLQSTLFAVFIGLLTLCFANNRAPVRYGLWFAASLKFLIPFSLIAAVGEALRWEIAPAAALDLAWPTFATVPVIAPVIAPVITPVVSALTTVNEIAQPAAPALAASEPGVSSPHVGSILIAIWLIGSALLLCRWTIQGLRLSAVRKASSPAPMNAPIPVRFSRSLFEPGLVGIFRPILLLPEDITAQLSPSQIALVIEHELCHWRRRDNLTAAIHMAVELMFWFNPLVWLIGARLVVERERACDESVLAACNNPKAYAASILEVCQFYVRSPLACAPGVAGADLKDRVARIMENAATIRLNPVKFLLLASIAAGSLLLPVASGLLTPSAVAAPMQVIALPLMQPVVAANKVQPVSLPSQPAPQPAPKTVRSVRPRVPERAEPAPQAIPTIIPDTADVAAEPSKPEGEQLLASLIPQTDTPILPAVSPPASPMEEVIVNGKRIREYVRTRTFARSYTGPSTFVDQISRWNTPLCVDTSGLGPRYDAFITARLREVGAQIGAPKVKTGACGVNLKIVFSDHPQEQLDDIKLRFPVLLGPHYASLREKLATVTHPIEAWYSTRTRDSRGRWLLDHYDAWWSTTPGGDMASFPVFYVPGSRILTGMTSEFATAVIVADIATVEGQDIGTVADYIAMMAFARPKTLDKCQELPSISNVLANCRADVRTTALSSYDTAYLKALYWTASDVPHDLQESAIGSAMQNILEQQAAAQKATTVQ